MPTGLIEILEDAFRLLLKNKIIFLPVLIVNLISLPFYLADFSRNSSEYLVGEILFSILGMFAYVATIGIAYSSVNKKYRGQGSRLVTINLVNFFLASILYLLIVLAGILLLIIPGIYFAVRLYLYPNAIVVDRKGPLESLKRSWKVTKGKWWLTFGIGLVIGLITLVALIPAIILMVVASDVGVIIGSTLLFLILIVTSVWGIVAYLILYLRISKHR